MNLLLLFSALLSALTGVSASARAPQVAIEQVVTATRTEAAVSPLRSARPVGALPGISVLARAPRAATWTLAAIEPIFASRRRE